MKMRKKLFAAAVLLGVLFSAGCAEPESPAERTLANEGFPSNNSSAVSRTRSNYITIIAAGDNLVHDIIYNSARMPENEEQFNFDPNYAPIKEIIKKADIAFVNQETVMGGKRFGHSGYPVFNTPQDAGLGLINAGFNVINQASNHTMDRGEEAVYGTMDFWESRGIRYLGIFRTEEDRNTKKQIIEKNGIKTGFLSYTYGLNGFVLPRNKPWLVGMIDREIMAREIDSLRPHCDLLVVSMHWGNEFQHTVSDYQRELAHFMAEHKVDIILGHHPHVTQPVESILRPDGNRLTVFYSLGDLLSHTQSSFTPDTMTGALAFIRVKKTRIKGKTSCAVDFAGVIPTVCHYGSTWRNPFIAYPLWDYTGELASKHYKSNMTIEYLNNVARQVFGIWVINKKEYESLYTPLYAIRKPQKGETKGPPHD